MVHTSFVSPSEEEDVAPIDDESSTKREGGLNNLQSERGLPSTSLKKLGYLMAMVAATAVGLIGKKTLEGTSQNAEQHHTQSNEDTANDSNTELSYQEKLSLYDPNMQKALNGQSFNTPITERPTEEITPDICAYLVAYKCFVDWFVSINKEFQMALRQEAERRGYSNDERDDFEAYFQRLAIQDLEEIIQALKTADGRTYDEVICQELLRIRDKYNYPANETNGYKVTQEYNRYISSLLKPLEEHIREYYYTELLPAILRGYDEGDELNITKKDIAGLHPQTPEKLWLQVLKIHPEEYAQIQQEQSGGTHTNEKLASTE